VPLRNRRHRARSVLAIALAVAPLGCGGATTGSPTNGSPDTDGSAQPDAGSTPDSASSTTDADPCEPVFTPGGPTGRACVHEVPNGASVSIDDAGNSTVEVNGKIVATYPPCPCNAPREGAHPADCTAGGLVACVQSCGEATDVESTAASCNAKGHWECPGPFIPAASCPPGSWPSGPFGDCGPWIEGYDCQCPPKCQNGAWTCFCNL